MADDPTISALERLKDESKWRIVRGVPIFKPFGKQRVSLGDGNFIDVDVTDADLKAICDSYLRRLEDTGTVGRITAGHIKPGLPERDQPAILGHPMNYRIGRWGPKNALGVLSDFYVKPECWDEFSKHPYRSPEYYHDKKEITGVAVLTRDPKLDLGMLSFSGREGCFYFAMDDESRTLGTGTMPGATFDPTEPPSVDAPTFDAGTDTDQPNAKGEPMPAEGVPPEFHQHFMATMKAHYPSLHSKLGFKEEGPAHMSEPAKPITPSPTPEAEAIRMEREQQAAQFARQEERLKLLEGQLADERSRRERAEVERRIIQFEAENPGIMFERATELDRMLPMKEEERGKHFQYMRKYYGRDLGEALTHPAHQRFVATPDNAVMFERGGNGGLPEEEFGDNDLPLANQYMRLHPDESWEKAREYALSQRRKVG